MSMTIGRAAITGDPMPDTLTQAGDVLSFTAFMSAASVDECKARIAQLSGLVDNDDEPVIPFTWSADASFDGFYRVESLSVQPLPVYLLTGACSFSVSLRRVGGFGRPQFESVSQSVVRTNAHGVTAPNGIVTAQASVGGAGDYDFVVGPIIDTADGVATLVRTAAAAPSAPVARRWAVPPASYFLASCVIEVKYGSTYYPVHGGQIPAGVGLNWRITNGLVRLTPSVTGSSGTFVIETFSAGAWFGRAFTMTQGTGLPRELTEVSSVAVAVRVIRNTPEMVVVRLRPGTAAEAEIVAPTFDLSMRRGDSWVEVSVIDGDLPGVSCVTATAATAFTGGCRATANDANGRRFLISTPQANTNDLTQGLTRITGPGTSGQFQVTANYLTPGTGIVTALRDSFLAARQERVRVVSR